MPSIVRIAETDLARASLLVQEGSASDRVVPADGTKPVLGVANTTARAGRNVTIELLDGSPITVAAGADISTGQSVQIASDGTVVPQSGAAQFGVALTSASSNQTVRIRVVSLGGNAPVTVVGSPEGTLVGSTLGQIALEIDVNGAPVTFWRFTGTPGQSTGWKSFGI